MTVITVVIFITVISVLVVGDMRLSTSHVTFCSNINVRSEMFITTSTLVRVSEI